MATNNSINNNLSTPFFVDGSPVDSTGAQFNFLKNLTGPPMSIVSVVIYDVPGTYTYTPPTGLLFIIVDCISGGGGGGAATSGATSAGAGGGGGGGGYSRKKISLATLSPNLTILVGAGGASAANGGTSNVKRSSTVLMQATGGQMGSAGTGALSGGAGGNGGSGSSGTVNISGGSGQRGLGATTLTGSPSIFGGRGGSPFFKSFSQYNIAIASSSGFNSVIYGGGGNGGVSVGGGSSIPGGAGSDGIVIITQFIAN